MLMLMMLCSSFSDNITRGVTNMILAEIIMDAIYHSYQFSLFSFSIILFLKWV
jgi:hypothetical protein